ncbi:MAG TPA: phospholipase D-like domain-containing protein [Caulobacteraceae bacterium]|nr:phospholipase D-like domain-containing protein [Caulobacteraceae bacterium]
MLLQPGLTCWRTAPAQRVSFLLDNSAYFSAAKAAMLQARRSIHLIGWAFDPLTQLEPGPDGGGPAADRIGEFLKRLTEERPELDVRLLIWKSALPIAASQHFFPHRARQCFKGSRVRFRLDATVPFGACHHQKVLVVDDQIAFCGGGDIGVDRWDTIKHREHDRRRTMPWGKIHGPRHEVMAMLEGPAARALGDLVRARWTTACGGDPAREPPEGSAARTEPEDSYWPEHVKVDLTDVRLGVARTLPDWRNQDLVRESEHLHLAAIAAAKRLIYLENQYVTAPIYAEALAARLSEPDGPEVVIVSTARAPSWFDHMTMDRTRSNFLQRLQAADVHGRFHAYCPFTRRGAEAIIIHSKVSIIDDRLLRAGSTNLNNRSAGFDSECDVAVEPGTDDVAGRAAIHRFRARLLAHYLGCTPEAFEAAHVRLGSLGGAIEALDAGEARRLRPLKPAALGPLARLIAAYHLGDPADPADSFRPWRRRADIEAERRAFLQDLRRVALRDSLTNFDPTPETLPPPRGEVSAL